MPLYEYKCISCEKVHEVMQKFSDTPLDQCPDCKGEVTKLMSLGSFALKGSGWYITDYKRVKAPQSPQSKEAASPATPIAPPSPANSAAPTSVTPPAVASVQSSVSNESKKSDLSSNKGA